MKWTLVFKWFDLAQKWVLPSIPNKYILTNCQCVQSWRNWAMHKLIFNTELYNLYLHVCGISTNNPTSIRTYWWCLLCIHRNVDLESDIQIPPSNLEKLGSYWIPPSGKLICLPVRKALAMFKRWMPSKVKLWALVTLDDMVTLKNFPPNWSV